MWDMREQEEWRQNPGFWHKALGGTVKLPFTNTGEAGRRRGGYILDTLGLRHILDIRLAVLSKG